MTCFDYAYRSAYQYCGAGYNYSYNECCSYAWIEFGWWCLGFAIFFIIMAIVCAARRKRMQQQQMYRENMQALNAPRQEVIVTTTTTG